jgi:hypothetical protein
LYVGGEQLFRLLLVMAVAAGYGMGASVNLCFVVVLWGFVSRLEERLRQMEEADRVKRGD